MIALVLETFAERPHAAEIALDDGWREFAASPAGGPRRGQFGQTQNFERAGAIGQATDEAAFLEREDQPVNARFRPQIERVLHLVEGRRHARLLQTLMDEAQQIVLFFGQHRRTAPQAQSLILAEPQLLAR